MLFLFHIILLLSLTWTMIFSFWGPMFYSKKSLIFFIFFLETVSFTDINGTNDICKKEFGWIVFHSNKKSSARLY